MGIRKNQRVGLGGQAKAMYAARMCGNIVKPTGKGSDFDQRNQFGDDSRDGLYEIKTGNAVQSPLQRETQRKTKKYYVQMESGVMEEYFI